MKNFHSLFSSLFTRKQQLSLCNKEFSVLENKNRFKRGETIQQVVFTSAQECDEMESS